MTPHRVLIVDDSAVIRRVLTEAVATAPSLQVVGTAANGRLALEFLARQSVDIVTLDIEMPEMDGLTTLRALRRTHPDLPVVMFSTLTMRGGAATLDALAAGATDYVPKPTSLGGQSAWGQLGAELIPKLEAICSQAVRAASPTRVAPAPVRGTGFRPGPRPEIVLIGSSTGGPRALAELIPALAVGVDVPVVVVQHMPPLFTRLLAERLDCSPRLQVREAFEGAPLRPGHAWIAPGDQHVEVRRSGREATLHLHQGPRENSCRPAVDVLFRSAALAFGPTALAVVLTGMGQDGLAGGTSIRQAGGRILVQDEPTSVVWGMPGALARAGMAHDIRPLGELAGAILNTLRPEPRARPAAPSLPEWR